MEKLANCSSMIEYVIPQNIDDRVLEKASMILKHSGIVCIPSDTSWVIVADPFSIFEINRIDFWSDRIHGDAV